MRSSHLALLAAALVMGVLAFLRGRSAEPEEGGLGVAGAALFGSARQAGAPASTTAAPSGARADAAPRGRGAAGGFREARRDAPSGAGFASRTRSAAAAPAYGGAAPAGGSFGGGGFSLASGGSEAGFSAPRAGSRRAGAASWSGAPAASPKPPSRPAAGGSAAASAGAARAAGGAGSGPRLGERESVPVHGDADPMAPAPFRPRLGPPPAPAKVAGKPVDDAPAPAGGGGGGSAGDFAGGAGGAVPADEARPELAVASAGQILRGADARQAERAQQGAAAQGPRVGYLPPVPGLQKQPIVFNGKMYIDTDGITRDSQAAASIRARDPYHQDGTSYMNGIIDTTQVPYIVLPLGFNGAQMGDLALVRYQGREIIAVCGDRGPRLGEASMAAARALGINPDGKSGGAEGGVTYIIFPGTAAPGLRSQEELLAYMQSRGAELTAALAQGTQPQQVTASGR